MSGLILIVYRCNFVHNPNITVYKLAKETVLLVIG